MEDKDFFNPEFDMRELICKSDLESEYNKNDNLCKKCQHSVKISYLKDVGNEQEIIGEVVSKTHCTKINLNELNELLYDEDMCPIIYDCSAYVELTDEYRKVYY